MLSHILLIHVSPISCQQHFYHQFEELNWSQNQDNQCKDEMHIIQPSKWECWFFMKSFIFQSVAVLEQAKMNLGEQLFWVDNYVDPVLVSPVSEDGLTKWYLHKLWISQGIY